jgi:hypothetical protein
LLQHCSVTGIPVSPSNKTPSILVAKLGGHPVGCISLQSTPSQKTGCPTTSSLQQSSVILGSSGNKTSPTNLLGCIPAGVAGRVVSPLPMVVGGSRREIIPSIDMVIAELGGHSS